MAWWFPNPGDDNSVSDIVIRNCNIPGGGGVTFIAWGTDGPDLSKQEIRNIEVYNNVLSGGLSIGAYDDNPYHGKTPWDATEVDFSPVKQVRFRNNYYRKTCNIKQIRATDFVTDAGLHSAVNFEYGDFERGNTMEPTWIAGLSNWTVLETEGYQVGNATAAGNTNHYGLIQNAGALAQGLWMTKGEHTFKVYTSFTSGTATLFVRDILTGTVISEMTPEPSEAFTEQTLTFVMEADADVYIGVRYTGDGSLMMDNADMDDLAPKPAPAKDTPAESDTDPATPAENDTDPVTETDTPVVTDTTADDTTAPATEATTEAPAKGSCKSVIAGGTLALLAAAGCVPAMRKKKDN